MSRSDQGEVGDFAARDVGIDRDLKYSAPPAENNHARVGRGPRVAILQLIKTGSSNIFVR